MHSWSCKGSVVWCSVDMGAGKDSDKDFGIAPVVELDACWGKSLIHWGLDRDLGDDFGHYNHAAYSAQMGSDQSHCDSQSSVLGDQDKDLEASFWGHEPG